MRDSKRMKTAFVCDWLTGMRGGERCLEAVCELFPQADIFTLVHFPGTVSKIIESHRIYTSYIQDLPGDEKTFRRYLPLFPHAIRRFDLASYDCVLSFSHCVAKGVRVLPNVPHICYCYTPMRYAWYMRAEYLSKFSGPKRWASEILLNYLRNWDKKSSSRVTHFIAISKNVEDRIKRAYGRDSVIIYPAVDCRRFAVSDKDDGYYLIVSALVPYKRVDLAVRAFKDFGRSLLIVGSGPELEHLKNIASPNVSFVENASDNEVAEYMKKCRALIFPGEEDFGIVPLEAQACGKPVIAFGKGGALETVINYDKNKPETSDATGILFYEQSSEALKNSILQFEEMQRIFNPYQCRKNALRFDRLVYRQSMKNYIQTVVADFRNKK